jgi:phosphoribosyl-ATP pyrophosphohydrolase
MDEKREEFDRLMKEGAFKPTPETLEICKKAAEEVFETVLNSVKQCATKEQQAVALEMIQDIVMSQYAGLMVVQAFNQGISPMEVISALERKFARAVDEGIISGTKVVVERRGK